MHQLQVGPPYNGGRGRLIAVAPTMASALLRSTGGSAASGSLPFFFTFLTLAVAAEQRNAMPATVP